MPCSDGASLALLVLPFRFQVEPGAPAPVVQERIAEFCRSEALVCLDLLPTFTRMGPAAFLDYDHLSAAGASLVADTLRASGLLPAGESDAEILARALAGRSASLAVLVELLGHAEAGVRQAAASALGAAGKAAAPVAGAVERSLRQDASPGVRAASARALGAIGVRAASPALFAARPT